MDKLPSFIIFIIFLVSLTIYLVDHIQVIVDTFKFVWNVIKKNDKKSPESVYYHKDIAKVIAGIKSENPTVQYEFLGIAESLVGLRPEFCFLMKIDDPDIVSEVTCNDETDKQIHFIDIRNMEKKKFWGYNKEKDSYDDLVKFNCTSAALFELARNSVLYGDCLK